MRKRKLPEHAEALLCLGDAEQAYQPRGLEREGRQSVSSCVGKLLQRSHVCGWCVCQPVDRDCCREVCQCV